MTAPTVHFLLVYSLKEGKLVDQKEFTDSAKAVKAYNEAEAAQRDNDSYEIVLIGSDSIQTIMKTHGHYFSNQGESIFSDLLLPTS